MKSRPVTLLIILSKIYGYWNKNRITNKLIYCRIERRVLSHYYDLTTGELKANGNLRDKNDNQLSFELTSEEMEYIKERLSLLVDNPFIHGLYSHAVWKYSHHRNYARIAIDDYLKIIKSENCEILTRLNLIRGTAYLSKAVKLHEEQINDAIYFLLSGNSVPTWAKSDIVCKLFQTKFFKSEDLRPYIQISKDWTKEERNDSYFSNENLLHTMIKVSQALNVDNKDFYLLLAENQNKIIEQHNGDFILPEILYKKASYYKKGGFEQEYKETMKLYTESKTRMKFSVIEIDILNGISDKLINDYLNSFTEWMLNLHDPIEILKFIASYSQWFPSKSDLEELSYNLSKNSIRQFANVISYDINGNPKILDQKSKMIGNRTDSFTLCYGIMGQVLLMRFLAKAIDLNLFSYDNLIVYLESTWLSERFIIANRKEHENESWIKIMQPGLKDLCNQFILMSKPETRKECNFILCMDSLVSKIEGSLRDLIRLLGGCTTIDKNGEISEKSLEQLLCDTSLTEYFDEREILFFRYVLTKDGINLRNNIAHGFTFCTNYTYPMAINVFLCIMKISSITA